LKLLFLSPNRDRFSGILLQLFEYVRWIFS
jgi:hypothetical protein